jgi:hypothetical protein
MSRKSIFATGATISVGVILMAAAIGFVSNQARQVNEALARPQAAALDAAAVPARYIPGPGHSRRSASRNTIGS